MNVRPLHYAWPEFYDHVIGLLEHSFSYRSIGRRFAAQGPTLSGGMNLVRGTSSEGWGRLASHRATRARLDADTEFRGFVDGQTQKIPTCYRDQVRAKLGPFWEYLPEGGLVHDPNAYLKKRSALRTASA